MKKDIGGYLKSLRNIFFVLFVNLLVFVCLLIFIEGLCSFILMDRKPRFVMDERRHFMFDDELGWKNKPDHVFKDIYGPGRDLTVNANGFRNKIDFSPKIPSGKIRVICSGDSFTLGHGVDDEDSWCQSLTRLDERIESVNMGQGGYSIGQAYLWYMRDGVKLDHDIHIFAFIKSDLDRMRMNKFLSYEKPVLKLKDGKIVISNQPLSKAYPFARVYDYIDWLRQFRILKVLERKFNRRLKKRDLSPGKIVLDEAEIKKIVTEIFQNLQEVNQSKNSKLVLVFLPTRRFTFSDRSLTYWRDFIAHEAKKNGIMFVDLIEDFEVRDRAEIKELFLRDGHYNEKGNQWVAERIYDRIRTLYE